MKRLAFIMMLLVQVKGFCQQQALISLVGEPGPVAPGGHVTLFLNMNLPENYAGTLTDSLQLPKNWRVLSQRKPQTSPAEKKLRYLIVVGTPENTPSGDYEINFHINAPGISASKAIRVPVALVRKIELMTVSQPEYVKEGDTLRVTYMVQNMGNNPEKLRLKSSYAKIQDWPDTLLLEPHATKEITVTRIIPFTETGAWQAASDLTIMPSDGLEVIEQVVQTPVFSQKIRKNDPYFRFPVEIGGGYMGYRYGRNTILAYQYIATGRGFLDEKNTHYLDFVVRGPNQFFFPGAGSYDQYSLAYKYRKSLAVVAGDYVLQLNNLMEFGRFGRGIKLDQEFAKVGYTAFFQTARFFPNQKESAGGKVYFRLGETSQVALNYTAKNIIFRDRQFWSNLAGISSNIRTRSMQIDAEFAAGKANDKVDAGGYLRFYLTKKWLSISHTSIYAGKSFYGFYNNSRLLSNNIGFSITNKLTLGVNNNYSLINPSLDVNFYSVSPKEESYSAYATFTPDSRNRFFAFYQVMERKDRQQPASFHFSENSGNLNYQYTGPKITMQYQGRYGYARNFLSADNDGRKQSFSNSIQPAVQMRPWVWVGGYFEHLHTSKFSTAGIIEDLFYYGGNARFNVKRNFQANIMYRNNYAPDELFVRRSFLETSCSLETKRHVFTLTGGRSYIPNAQNRDQNTLYFSARYALRLNVPLSRKRNIGKVSGRITGTGFAKQGNLIQIGGQQYLTDTSGKFHFEGLAPDQYYLTVKQNDAMQTGVIATVKLPLKVDVNADSVRLVEIPFTKTGSITGKISFTAQEQAGVGSALNEKPAVLLKISNGNTSMLTQPNEKGAFSFKEILPGEWTLTAFIPGEQDRFVIDDHIKNLSLATDQTIDVSFQVKPNARRIHFSGKSFDLSVKK